MSHQGDNVARQLTIDSIVINDDSDCYVIAEIGHNHQGDVEKCKQLFRTAKECGVNAVKLQKRDNRALYTRAMYNKPYENENSFGETYGEHREFLEFGRDEYIELIAFCREIDLTLFATAFDAPSVDFLLELDMPAIKFASGDLKNIPLLRYAAQFNKPMIVSTGGGSLEDAQRAYDAIMPINPQLSILQCTATYPSEADEINLRTIETFRTCFPDIVIGLSDHYNGIVMAPVAYVLGARIIEKHFTLNHTWKGSDHAMSLEPIGMNKMIRDLRRIRLALGDGVKMTLPQETSAITKMGKTLFAARPLPVGHVLTAEDIAVKSPGGGLPPYQLDKLIGRTLTRALNEEELITFDHVGGER